MALETPGGGRAPGRPFGFNPRAGAASSRTRILDTVHQNCFQNIELPLPSGNVLKIFLIYVLAPLFRVMNDCRHLEASFGRLPQIFQGRKQTAIG
jgi:hypothetical protein